jgi:hypothetical protein
LNTFNFIGSIASIIGLVISAFLIYFTKGAKKAAQEAKELVYGKNILFELREIKKYVDQSHAEIEKRFRHSSMLLLNESFDRINYFKTKWARELQGRGNISFIAKELSTALENVDSFGLGDLQDEEKRRLLIAIHKITQYLNEELGFFERRLSREN